MAPRYRSEKHSSLHRYPGLYQSEDGVYFVIHPITKKRGTLDTRDRNQAIRLWSMLNHRWEAEVQERKTNALAEKLDSLSIPASKGDHILLQDYLKKWRTEVLGHQIKGKSIVWSECRVLSLRGPNKGAPIAKPTRVDYASDARQLEQSDDAKFPLSDPQILRKIRKLLSPWLPMPTHYNGLKNTLNRVFLHAVQEGLIDRNPMIDIRKAAEEKRQVLIPDEAYRKITEHLCVHRHNKRDMDGTWRAKICDLIYMMSQQPIDVFNLKESQGELYDEPIDRGDYLAYGVIRFARHKTKIGIELEMNEDLADLWKWFVEFKRKEAIISEYLLVYPRYFDKRSRAQQVKHRTMQAAWRDACKTAGYGGMYHLRDLRKKGLTEEFLSQGENDKGGHETQAMRNHYRLIKPPKRARTTIRFEREQKLSE